MTAPSLSGESRTQRVPRKDNDRLQGVWNAVSGRRPVQLLIAGHHFAVKFQDGDLYMGTFRLDARRRPKTMEMLVREGPARHKGKVALCIYELDGETLHWCPNEPGKEEALKEFPGADDPKYLDTVFQRERP